MEGLENQKKKLKKPKLKDILFLQYEQIKFFETLLETCQQKIP